MRTIERPLTAAAMACIAFGACTDSPTEPGELWVALETEPALRIDTELPTLPNLLERVRSRERDGAEPGRASASRDLDRAGALWRRTREAAPGSAAARRLRERAYRIAADELAAALDTAELRRLNDGLRRWIEAAAATGVPARVPSVSTALARSRRSLDGAREARAAGDRAGEVTATLRAAEWLAALTPSAVARRLIRRAETLASASPDAGARPSARSVARAKRLLAGAHDALAKGDPVRAIRRAYYAARLLEPR